MNDVYSAFCIADIYTAWRWGLLMKFSYAMGYLQEDLNELNECLQKKKEIYDNVSSSIIEIEEKLKIVTSDIDGNYEVFSPISVKYQTQKEESEKLLKRLNSLNIQKDELGKEIEQYSVKKVKLENALKEVSSYQEEKSDFEINGIEVLEQQENERMHIARELHDTTVQNLTALIHKIEFCIQIIDSDVIRTKIELELAISEIRKTIADIREMICNLRQISIDDIEFSETLYHCIQRIQRNMDITVHFHIFGIAYDLDDIVKLSIMRIIQEATNNSKKYSLAKNINIMLAYEEEGIYLSIRDDGVGFDFEKEKNCKKNDNSGLGLAMMKERVFLLSGTITINSEKNQGTEISVKIPKGKCKRNIVLDENSS